MLLAIVPKIEHKDLPGTLSQIVAGTGYKKQPAAAAAAAAAFDAAHTPSPPPLTKTRFCHCVRAYLAGRGWCRLETQVHELRLFEEPGGELMPGVPESICLGGR